MITNVGVRPYSAAKVDFGRTPRQGVRKVTSGLGYKQKGGGIIKFFADLAKAAAEANKKTPKKR